MTGLGIWRLYFNFVDPEGGDNLLKFLVREYARSIDAASAFLIQYWNTSLGGWLPKLNANPLEASLCLTVIPVSLRLIQLQVETFRKEPDKLKKLSWVEYPLQLAPASWGFAAICLLFYGSNDDGIDISFNHIYDYIVSVILWNAAITGIVPILVFATAPLIIVMMLFGLARDGEQVTSRDFRFAFPILRLWCVVVGVAALSLF